MEALKEPVLRPQYEWRHKTGYVGVAIYETELSWAEVDQITKEQEWSLVGFRYVEWPQALLR